MQKGGHSKKKTNGGGDRAGGWIYLTIFIKKKSRYKNYLILSPSLSLKIHICMGKDVHTLDHLFDNLTGRNQKKNYLLS